MTRTPILSRRDWLIATAGAGLGFAVPPALAQDHRAPTELDRDWLKATAKYAPERARRLADVRKGRADGPFRPDWASLQSHKTPQWYADAKFGIFIHWGLYSIPAFGSEWYSRDMYV